MAKFNAINALNTLFTGFLAVNVPNLTVKPDFLRNLRGTFASTVQLLVNKEQFVPLNSNGTYRDERYNIPCILQTNVKDDISNVEQVFRDTIAEYERLMQANNLNDPNRDADFEIGDYDDLKETSRPAILFVVTRRAVLIIEP